MMKTIAITGATDGLGRAVAEELSAEGHTLLLHGRSEGRLDAGDGIGSQIKATASILTTREPTEHQ